VAVPTSPCYFTALRICRVNRPRAHSGGETWNRRWRYRVIAHTAANQIWNRCLVARPLWLNISLRDSRAGDDNFPLKTADNDVQRAMGKQVCAGIVKTCLGKLPVRNGVREISQRHAR